ncbi:MAG: transposase [Psychromonas sp.]|nr:transposase [Psychromonas sp.]
MPPYSPVLNLVEQLWQHLKQRYLSNMAFKNYDDIVDKSCEACNNILNETNFVSKSCGRKWIKLV